MTTHILILPVDILVNIFKRLHLPDLHNLMLSCKTFRTLIMNDNTIWRPLSWNKLMIDLSDSSKSNVLWYDRCRISHNWTKGYYKSKVLIHHYTNYMPWLTFYNSEILLVSAGSVLLGYPINKKGLPNCTQALWKLDVPIVRRHDVRTNDISRFVMKNNFLVCGNRDGCIAVYNVNNPRRRPQLKYHIRDCHENGEVEVTAVEMIDGGCQTMVITGSSDSAYLRFYNLRSVSNENVMLAPTDPEKNVYNISMYETAGAKCMALNNTANKLAIGLNGNSKPLLLEVNNPCFLMTADTTKNPKQAVRDIRWHDDHTILYVTHSGVLQLIDIRTHKVVYDAKDPFQSTFYCVKSDGRNGIVAGSAEYSRCVLFDIRNQIHHVQMYFTQRKTSPVYSLDFDPYQLITAVDRGVAVLDFNVIGTSEQQKDYSDVFFDIK